MAAEDTAHSPVESLPPATAGADDLDTDEDDDSDDVEMSYASPTIMPAVLVALPPVASSSSLQPVAPPPCAQTRSFTCAEDTIDASATLGPNTRSRSTSTASHGSIKQKGGEKPETAGKRIRQS